MTWTDCIALQFFHTQSPTVVHLQTYSRLTLSYCSFITNITLKMAANSRRPGPHLQSSYSRGNDISSTLDAVAVLVVPRSPINVFLSVKHVMRAALVQTHKHEIRQLWYVCLMSIFCILFLDLLISQRRWTYLGIFTTLNDYVYHFSLSR